MPLCDKHKSLYPDMELDCMCLIAHCGECAHPAPMPTLNEDHTPGSTHWACAEAFAIHGAETKCCVCTRHECTVRIEVKG